MLAMFVWVETHTAEPILPIRLFASPVFTVCCILGFIVGFAMLGALTFLPTFMQFVDGVSATVSNATFSTYIQTGTPGVNRFRVIDSDTKRASNEVRVRVR